LFRVSRWRSRRCLRRGCGREWDDEISTKLARAETAYDEKLGDWTACGATIALILRAIRPAGRLAVQTVQGSRAQAVRLDGLRRKTCGDLARKPSGWTACGAKLAGILRASRPAGRLAAKQLLVSGVQAVQLDGLRRKSCRLLRRKTIWVLTTRQITLRDSCSGPTRLDGSIRKNSAAECVSDT